MAAALIAASLTIVAARARAQAYPFSQHGEVLQHVAFTTLTITYGRPVARGRALFGALVPWDSIWHPGADSATLLRVDHDITVEGHPVAAGEYSLWLVPHAQGPWTVIFSHAAHTFHKPYPGAAYDALRFDVAPETLSHMETLEIGFPLVLRNRAILEIHWGTVGVPIHLTAPWRPPPS